MARLGDSVAKQEIQPFRCSIFFGSVDREMRCNLRFGNLFVNEVQNCIQVRTFTFCKESFHFS